MNSESSASSSSSSNSSSSSSSSSPSSSLPCRKCPRSEMDSSSCCDQCDGLTHFLPEGGEYFTSPRRSSSPRMSQSEIPEATRKWRGSGSPQGAEDNRRYRRYLLRLPGDPRFAMPGTAARGTPVRRASGCCRPRLGPSALSCTANEPCPGGSECPGDPETRSPLHLTGPPRAIIIAMYSWSTLTLPRLLACTPILN